MYFNSTDSYVLQHSSPSSRISSIHRIMEKIESSENTPNHSTSEHERADSDISSPEATITNKHQKLEPVFLQKRNKNKTKNTHINRVNSTQN